MTARTVESAAEGLNLIRHWQRHGRILAGGVRPRRDLSSPRPPISRALP